LSGKEFQEDGAAMANARLATCLENTKFAMKFLPKQSEEKC